MSGGVTSLVINYTYDPSVTALETSDPTLFAALKAWRTDTETVVSAEQVAAFYGKQPRAKVTA